jgi:brevianamide F synthase
MQSWFIDRAGIDSFCFFLRGKIDHVRLQDACRTVVQAHSVLRTIFTKGQDGTFQVILPTFEPTLSRVTTTMASDDLQGLCDKICQSSPGAKLHLDRIIVQFVLVSVADDSNRHALIIRLSHCQHDGFSIPSLFKDLAAVYDGVSLAPRTQFVDYCRHRFQHGVAAGYEFWRKYLHGASMTHPNAHSRSRMSQHNNHRPGTRETIEASIRLDFVPVPPHGITLATVVKAAWAVALGELTGKTDLVFGETVNGRSGLSFAGIETVLGPCLNFAPIRIHLKPGQSGQEFLSHVQEQHLQTTAFDYLDFSGIVKNSTRWPPATGPGCIFQHQNVDHQFHLPFKSVENDKTVSYLQLETGSEIWVFSIPHYSHLELRIRSGPHSLSSCMANALVEKMALAVQALVDQPGMPLARLMQM